MNNTLYYGDNLDILRQHVPDESVDLVYLDPPFNYNYIPYTVSGYETGVFQACHGFSPSFEVEYNAHPANHNTGGAEGV